MRYTFGDTITASDRLKRIADFFNPLSGDFISRNTGRKAETAIDLGCGPGFTTAMLAGVTGAKRVTGIDLSDNFLAYARTHHPGLHFIRHNVTLMPLPVKADMIYFRFLLSHLKSVRHLVENWLTSLHPGGCLIIDELEDIYTETQVFIDYLAINNGLINSQGANLFVGKTLSKELQGLEIRCNHSALIPVEDRLAASWFYPNTVSVWQNEEYVASRINDTARIKIADELADLGRGTSGTSSITWRMRRMIISGY